MGRSGIALLFVVPAILFAAEACRAQHPPTHPSALPSDIGRETSLPILGTEPAVGYHRRACGFDLDDDGVVGEPEDCRICDGRTTDPDGDGVDEDLVYVDAGKADRPGGSDSSGDGSPEKPFRTLTHALAHLDGPGDGAEDIVCFRGIAREGDLRPAVAGVAGHFIEPRQGSQARAWQRPSQPAMIVGWDYDQDGIYPPADAEDEAVIDGSAADDVASRPAFAFEIGAGDDYLELAHFTVRGFGQGEPPGPVHRGESTPSGFVRFGDGGGVAHHLLFHDLELEGINGDRYGGGHRIVFYLFTRGTFLHHVAFVNLSITETSSFLVRGTGGHLPGSGLDGLDFGPLRWQNLTVTVRGADEHCDDEDCVTGFFVGWKLWSHLSGIEVLDSVLDSQIRQWHPTLQGGNAGTLFVHPTQCSQDWTIRNNTVRDFNLGLNVDGGFDPRFCGRAWEGRRDLDGDGQLSGEEQSLQNECRHVEGIDNGTCLLPPEAVLTSIPRPVDGVVFENNRFVNTWPGWPSVVGAQLRGGRDPETTVRDVTVANNLFASVSGFYACIAGRIGNGVGPNGGTLRLIGNRCFGSTTHSHEGALVLGAFPTLEVYPQQSVVIEGNRFGGLDPGEVAIRLRYRPRALRLRGNIYPLEAVFLLGTERYDTLDGWRSAVEGDAQSFRCGEAVPCLRPPWDEGGTLEPRAGGPHNSALDAEGVRSRVGGG